jgi:excisionase family DNA binding protein
MMAIEKQALTAAEVAEVLDIPLQSVWRLARTGKLPATRLGRVLRFPRAAIERLADGPQAGGTRSGEEGAS